MACFRLSVFWPLKIVFLMNCIVFFSVTRAHAHTQIFIMFCLPYQVMIRLHYRSAMLCILILLVWITQSYWILCCCFTFQAFILQTHIVVLLASSLKIWKGSGCCLWLYFSSDWHHIVYEIMLFSCFCELSLDAVNYFHFDIFLVGSL